MAALTHRSVRARLSDETGAQLVEFALVLPLLLLVVLGILDFGLLFHRYEVLTNAVREGARIAILPGYEEADVQARVRQYLQASGLDEEPTFTPLTTETIPLDEGSSSCVTVRGLSVTYPHEYLLLGGIMSYFGGEELGEAELSVTSRMRSERGTVSCS